MKTLTLLGVMAMTTILGACTTTSPKNESVGMANPASEFCVKQGGKSQIRTNQDGSEYGVCVLPNGQEVEEWAYFRQHNGK
ncbi:TPA: putative hemolysin [Mannheimia haemolytica]